MVVPGIAKAQLVGIGFTVVFAWGCGSLSGYLIRLFGAKLAIYRDNDEFLGVEPVADESVATTMAGAASPLES
jgi:ammonium transporter Rh